MLWRIFFRREKLVALREITLRRTADRVNHIAEEERYAMGEMDYHTGEHVLVCISPSPSNTKVIRTAKHVLPMHFMPNLPVFT